METDELLSRITIDAEVCGGRPCVRGMRIRVTDILSLIAAGETPEQIVRDYPSLEPDDVRAAVAYAAQLTDRAGLRSA